MEYYKFKNEQSVLAEADVVLGKILSDKSYSNPQKLSLLIQEYQKKQVKLDAQLSKCIRSEIESIKQSKQSVQEANEFMKEANEKTEKLAQLWSQQGGFHEFMQDMLTLQIFQNNVGKIIQQLTYFIDMESEMQKLQKMAEDQQKYLTVSSKLLTLIQLRDALLEDSAWQRQSVIMRNQFRKVDNFQTTFFDKIFHKFSDCIRFAKQNPEGLKIAVRVIESYDKMLESKGKEKVLRTRALVCIEEAIQHRFNQELQDQQDLIGIIQNAQFATKDLVDVNDYVQPCFPKQFPIMHIYQQNYQKHIETRIFPYFEQIQEEKQYGHLVLLLGWIDDYETMLSRAGLDSTNLVNLKSKVKVLMPYFLEHNRKIVQDYISGAIQEDKKKFNRKFYQEVIRDGADLISMFPSDIFRFINQQAQVIKDQLKGEIFIQFVRCITDSLNCFEKDLVNQIEEQWKQVRSEEKQDQIVNFEYKVILLINNYNECLKHAGESKELFSQYVNQEYRNRIDKIFLTEVQKEFNQSIPRFINLLIEIIFLNVLKDGYPCLFTAKWLSDKSGQAMSYILKTVAVELNDIEQQGLIINIIHYRILVKEALQFLVNAYIEQLILLISNIHKIKYSQVRYCNNAATIRKIQQEPNTDFMAIFNSKVALTQAIKKDKLSFIKFADNFTQCTSKAFMEKLKTKFGFLVDLFIKKNKEFQILTSKMAEIFPQKASQLLEAILIVRQDIENRALTLPKKGMGYD